MHNMGETSLQSVITETYGLNETLLIEGKFVVLVAGGNDAESLVSLGISDSQFITAALDLSGTDIDYNVTSVTPLSFLSFKTDNQSRRLTVCNVLNVVHEY